MLLALVGVTAQSCDPASFAEGKVTSVDTVTRTVELDGVPHLVAVGVDIDELHLGDDVTFAYFLRNGERLAVGMSELSGRGRNKEE